MTSSPPLQLECGKNSGLSFRIIAPTMMNTKLGEDFLQKLPVPATEVLANAPEADAQPVEYVDMNIISM